MKPFSEKSPFQKLVELLKLENDGNGGPIPAVKKRRPRGPFKSRYSGFLLTNAAARYVGVHQRTIERWRKDGTLQPVRKTPGGHALYSKDQLRPHRTENAEPESSGDFPWND